jgi:hypothetical protein
MRPAVSRGWTHPRYQVLLHAEARVAALDRRLDRLARLERKVDERLVVGCGNEDGEPAESSASLRHKGNCTGCERTLGLLHPPALVAETRHDDLDQVLNAAVAEGQLL